ncbi:MAG: hypothetical protein KatS3mg034_1655 [Vicingaceae bacterium]|nr:MAG: hypothetical protein KatS3mg034_1655 [Vicingaceae bacterium]
MIKFEIKLKSHYTQNGILPIISKFENVNHYFPVRKMVVSLFEGIDWEANITDVIQKLIRVRIFEIR